MKLYDGHIKGPNPHQEAHAVGVPSVDFAPHVRIETISLGVLKNIDAAQQTLYALRQREPLCIVIKHKNACAVASGDTPKEVLLQAIRSTTATQSGVLAINTTLTKEMADDLLTHLPSVTAVLAHDFDSGALQALEKRGVVVCKNKPITLDSKKTERVANLHVTYRPDTTEITEHDLQKRTVGAADVSEYRDLTLGMNLVRVLDSNAVAVVVNGIVIGIGKSTETRTDAIREALRKADAYTRKHPEIVGAQRSFASDGSISENDFMLLSSSEYPTHHVVLPFDSKTTEAISKLADAKRMSVYTTSTRHLT